MMFYSSGRQGAILAAIIPAANIIKMLLLGLGIYKDDATVKSMSRFGDHRYVVNAMETKQINLLLND